MAEISTPFALEPVTVVASKDSPAATDGPIAIVAANGVDGLETRVVDVRYEVPDAFPPRTTDARCVTDTTSFVAELNDRPLIAEGENPEQVRSTVWANRRQGTITAVYDDLPADATADYTRRADQLVLKFVRNQDWIDMLAAADSAYHEQEEFGDLIESAGHLIVSHQAADLLEIVDSIRASSSGTFESKIQRATGAQTVTWAESVDVSAGTRKTPLEVPREIVFEVAPFEDYPAIEVACWLRLRIRGGGLGIGLFPKPYEHRIRASWQDVVDDVANRINHTIYADNR